MEENKDYQVYRFDYLTEGSQLKLDHSVYCEDVDISSLITQSADALEALRQDSMDGEQKAFEIVQAAAKQWEQQAAVTQKLNRALEYLRTPEVAHTANQWQPNQNNSDWEEISNKVYKMSCRIREDTSYDRIKKVMVPTAWYVTWDLYLNSPKDGHNIHLAGQNQKRYTDKAAAMKYLEGRKKAYSHLFTEISPQIPKEYERHFTVNGALLPGYTVEGQEPVKAEHTAAEVSEGGISLPEKTGKPSVLGKLAAAKSQEKAPAAPAATKKKEDMQL